MKPSTPESKSQPQSGSGALSRNASTPRGELRAALTDAMNAVGDMAWSGYDTPQREEAIKRLNASLLAFEDALDRAGL